MVHRFDTTFHEGKVGEWISLFTLPFQMGNITQMNVGDIYGPNSLDIAIQDTLEHKHNADVKTDFRAPFTGNCFLEVISQYKKPLPSGATETALAHRYLQMYFLNGLSSFSNMEPKDHGWLVKDLNDMLIVFLPVGNDLKDKFKESEDVMAQYTERFCLDQKHIGASQINRLKDAHNEVMAEFGIRSYDLIMCQKQRLLYFVRHTYPQKQARFAPNKTYKTLGLLYKTSDLTTQDFVTSYKWSST